MIILKKDQAQSTLDDYNLSREERNSKSDEEEEEEEEEEEREEEEVKESSGNVSNSESANKSQEVSTGR